MQIISTACFSFNILVASRRCACVQTHSSLFITACQHDQTPYVLLPDHPPEIVDCAGQRTLSCDKLLPRVVTLSNKTSARHTQHKRPSC